MSVEIPAIQGHVHPAGSDLDGRRRVDPETFATTVPVEDDPTVGDIDPAVLQFAVASLVKPETIGSDLDKMFIGAPGSQKNELIVFQWSLAGRDGKYEQAKCDKKHIDLHE